MIGYKDAVSSFTLREAEQAAILEVRIDYEIKRGDPRHEPIRVDVVDAPDVVLEHLHARYRAGGWHTEVKESPGTRGVTTFILTRGK